MPNQIVLLAPARLHEIIQTETLAGRRDELARALLRLVELQCDFLKTEAQPMRATILPLAPDRHSTILCEIAWGIISNPRPGPHGGIEGDRVLNGGLIQHSDLAWSNHT